ncbi:MAG: hypothetical protein V4693_03160 [Pseudomonadota bacterium]
MMRLKKFGLALALCSICSIAQALSKNLCTIRANMIAAVAVERDKGVPKNVVLKKLQKELGPRASGIQDYVNGVYLATSMTPDDVWQKVLQLCLDE